jgi:outer membrane protein assembly factor BamB/enterochelin esterase-like enzyme
MKTFYAIGMLLVGAFCAFSSTASEWRQWRGPERDGSGFGIAPAAHDGDVRVEVAWRRALGSGYSSVSVTGGLAVTMASIDGGDWVVAPGADTGGQAWRFRVADTYRGRAGSDDGPASTPALDETGVFAHTASGHVVALELATGELRWRRHLEEDFGAAPHTYGYSAAPAVFGDLVFLLGGPAPDSAVLALDARTGELRWSAGSGAVEHQNPLVARLAGVDQVVAPTARAVAGLAVEDGTELWRHEFASGSHSGDATPLDGEHLLVTRWDGNTLLRITERDGGLQATEIWTTKDLESTYAVPVPRDGHLYGFDSRFLTCVSLATGERVWRSRPPGGSGLILVDGLIATLSSQGELVLAEAAPHGYREHSRLPLFAPRRVMTPPSVAGGLMFVRNLEEIVALRPATGRPSRIAARTSDEEDAESTLMQELLSRIRGAPDKAAVVDDLLSRHPEMPVVEDGRAHFFYRGQAADLVITGDMTGGFAELPLERLPGTDLFHRSFPAPPGEGKGGEGASDERWEYVFKSFDETILDPRNPHAVATPAGQRSVAFFARAKRAAVCPECLPGRLATLRASDGETTAGYGVQVYLPAEYDAEPDREFPLVLWGLGREAVEYGRIPQLLDAVVGRRAEPLIAAFLELPESLLWEPQREDFRRAMSEVVLPSLEATFRITPEPAKRALVVQQWAVENALPWVVGEERVGKLAAQSPMMGEHYVERTATPLADTERKLVVYLDWGRYDGRNSDWGLDVAAQAAALVGVLETAGHSVRAFETPGGSNWTRWRSHTADMLATLFPPID